MKEFDYSHLPPELHDIGKDFAALANRIQSTQIAGDKDAVLEALFNVREMLNEAPEADETQTEMHVDEEVDNG